MSTDLSDPDQFPLYEIAVDWGAFRRLPPDQRELFVELAGEMQVSEWFGRNARPKKEWACIDLSEYADYGDFLKALKKQGKSFYEGRKAENRGYYSKFFEERTFVGDVVAINTSAPERQGRPMSDGYRRTVEQMGGYPTEIRAPAIPAQSVFWQRSFGTFRTLPGHSQGPLVTGEQLVAYLSVRRYGNFAHYTTILGHKDYLRDGVVNKMHLDFVKAALEARNAPRAEAEPDGSLSALRFVCYAAYFGFAGLTHWKKSNLFRPGCFYLNPHPMLLKTDASR